MENPELRMVVGAGRTLVNRRPLAISPGGAVEPSAISGVLLILLVAAVPLRASDTDPYEAIATANAAFADGRFDEALSTYEAAAEVLGDTHALDYNRAAAQYKLGNYSQAAELFARAAMARDGQLSRRSRFAWGNCDYASALAGLQPADPQAGQPPDLEGGLGKLASAIRHYRDALAVGGGLPADDPDDRAARENIERAQQLIEAIQEFMQQQQQQQQDQQSEQQDEQQKSGDQEQEQQDQDQDQEQDQQEEQQDQRQQGEEQDQQEEQQDQQQAAEPQPDQDEQQGRQQDAAEQQMQERRMTPEEVEALLQAVRDKEQKRREEKLLRMRARRVPVTRDW